MIVDTSAVLAIAFGDPGFESLLAALEQSDSTRISAATWTETFVVADKRLDAAGVGRLEQLLEDLRVDIVDVTPSQASLARRAYRDFGKGNHPAGLNFGDCFAYALAKETRDALLCVGDDFAKTDVLLAIELAIETRRPG